MVGMDYHLETLKSLIEIESNGVRIIGIYELGGVGKPQSPKLYTITSSISLRVASSLKM